MEILLYVLIYILFVCIIIGMKMEYEEKEISLNIIISSILIGWLAPFLGAIVIGKGIMRYSTKL